MTSTIMPSKGHCIISWRAYRLCSQADVRSHSGSATEQCCHGWGRGLFELLIPCNTIYLRDFEMNKIFVPSIVPDLVGAQFVVASVDYRNNVVYVLMQLSYKLKRKMTQGYSCLR